MATRAEADMAEQNGGIPRNGAGLTTALLYRRVSKDDMAREGMSLPTQLAETRAYVSRQDGWLIGSEYEDVLSGKRDDRPNYQALLAEVRQLRASGRRVVVVVAQLDRFGRRLLERVRAREELKALGVQTHSVREGGEVSDLTANILASVAEEEVRVLGERVRAVRHQAIKNGWRPVGRPAWGYRWRDATEEDRAQGAPRRVLEVDTERASYLREAFHRVDTGESVRKVARWAQALPGDVRENRELPFSGIREILSSELYIARPDAGAADVLSRPVGRWPALVDDALWRRVQERINDHARLPHQASGKYLLTGFLRCPLCGGRMAGSTWRKAQNGAEYRRYSCRGCMAGASAERPNCQWNTPMPAVDAIVLAEVGELVEAVATTNSGMQAALRKAWRSLAKPAATEGIVRRVREAERRAKEARRRLRDAAVKLVDGELDKEGYESVRDLARADLEAAEEELAQFGSHNPAPALPDIDLVLREAGDWRKVLAEADTPARRDVLALLIDRAVPGRAGWRSYTVAITWTPLGSALKALAAAKL